MWRISSAPFVNVIHESHRFTSHWRGNMIFTWIHYTPHFTVFNETPLNYAFMSIIAPQDRHTLAQVNMVRHRWHRISWKSFLIFFSCGKTIHFHRMAFLLLPCYRIRPMTSSAQNEISVNNWNSHGVRWHHAANRSDENNLRIQYH